MSPVYVTPTNRIIHTIAVSFVYHSLSFYHHSLLAKRFVLFILLLLVYLLRLNTSKTATACAYDKLTPLNQTFAFGRTTNGCVMLKHRFKRMLSFFNHFSFGFQSVKTSNRISLLHSYCFSIHKQAR